MACACQLSTEWAPVLNRAPKECSAYWNAIKSARHFLKTPCCDLILPHFTILCCGFSPIMFSWKERGKKMFYQSDLSSCWPQQQLAYKSGGGCYCITVKPILQENVCCVCTVQTVIPQHNRGRNRKGQMIRLVNFISPEQYRLLQFYGRGWISEFPLNRIRLAPLLVWLSTEHWWQWMGKLMKG